MSTDFLCILPTFAMVCNYQYIGLFIRTTLISFAVFAAFYLSVEDLRFYKRGIINILLVSVAGFNPPLR